MVKIIVNTELEERTELEVKGATPAVLDELAYSVYRVLAKLNMHEHTLKERFDLFHGGLMFHALAEGHDIFEDVTEDKE